MRFFIVSLTVEEEEEEEIKRAVAMKCDTVAGSQMQMCGTASLNREGFRRAALATQQEVLLSSMKVDVHFTFSLSKKSEGQSCCCWWFAWSIRTSVRTSSQVFTRELLLSVHIFVCFADVKFPGGEGRFF